MLRELRPRFEVHRDEDARVLLERIDLQLRSNDGPLVGHVIGNRILICVSPARQRLWSAELRVDVVTDGAVTRLEGRYAPHPHVWVTYVIVLAAVVVSVGVVLVFALAQWLIQQRPVALYGLVPALLLGAVTYATAFVGQRFATDEMDELRAFLDQSLDYGPVLRSHIRNLRPTPSQDSSSVRGA